MSLPEFLRENEVGALYVCGLTTDYCVKASALDAIKQGIHAHVITDAIAAVDAQPGDGKKALNELYANGCILIESSEV